MSGTSKFLARFASEVKALLTGHETDKQNPHATTKAQVGLGSVNDLPIANANQVWAALDDAYLTPSSGRTAIQNELKTIVKETFTLATGATKAYNLTTLLGSRAAQYDIINATISLRVKDPDSGSATFGYYIGAEAVGVVGLKTTGEVLVKNLYEASLEYAIVITVPRK